jgi:hypothetical protein
MRINASKYIKDSKNIGDVKRKIYKDIPDQHKPSAKQAYNFAKKEAIRNAPAVRKAVGSEVSKRMSKTKLGRTALKLGRTKLGRKITGAVVDAASKRASKYLEGA